MIAELHRKEELLGYLRKDTAAAVYFIGDLDDRYFDKCRWFASVDAGSGEIESLVLLYSHPAAATLLTLGEAAGIQETVKAMNHRWPSSFHAHLLPHHLPVFREHYAITGSSEIIRMVIRKDELNHHQLDKEYHEIVELTEKHGGAINELLRDYPGNFFSPEDLQSEYYYGLFDGVSLAAMCGVHAVPREFHIAALGNVVTRTSERGKGYARRCTGYLLNELCDFCDLVALNVKADNKAATRLYEKIGFKRYAILYLCFCEKNIG